MHQTADNPKKLIIVSVETPDFSDCRQSAAELKELCENLNAVVLDTIFQKRSTPHPATCIGEGKIAEVREALKRLECDAVVFDTELTAMQSKNLEKALDIDVRDRTMIILDVFADRAQSSEGKIQVELARLQYMLPRLKGSYQSLSRIRGSTGGIGAAKGLGESKLELDKRYLRGRIRFLKKQISDIQSHREVLRQRRKKQDLPVIAICGYTNAGKSTLLNALTFAEVFAEDMLFATLDTTSRSISLPGDKTAILVDTVGFIRRLPHHLVEAFKSTLEEVLYADLVLLLLDAGDPEYLLHMDVCKEVLQQLNYRGKILIALNKTDLPSADLSLLPSAVKISAKSGQGLDQLLESISAELEPRRFYAKMNFPYSHTDTFFKLKTSSPDVKWEYTDDGISAEGMFEQKVLAQYNSFCAK